MQKPAKATLVPLAPVPPPLLNLAAKGWRDLSVWMVDSNARQSYLTTIGIREKPRAKPTEWFLCRPQDRAQLSKLVREVSVLIGGKDSGGASPLALTRQYGKHRPIPAMYLSKDESELSNHTIPLGSNKDNLVDGFFSIAHRQGFRMAMFEVTKTAELSPRANAIKAQPARPQVLTACIVLNGADEHYYVIETGQNRLALRLVGDFGAG